MNSTTTLTDVIQATLDAAVSWGLVIVVLGGVFGLALVGWSLHKIWLHAHDQQEHSGQQMGYWMGVVVGSLMTMFTLFVSQISLIFGN